MPNGRTWTDDEIVEAVREFGTELGRAPTMNEWRAKGKSPSGSVIARRMGWRKAVGAAGFTARTQGGRTVPLDRTKALERIRIVGAELGHPPSRREWNTHEGRPCSSEALVTEFGTWSQFLQEAGFHRGRGGDRTISREDIVHAIQDVAAEFGYLPRVREWKSLPDGGPLAMRTIENTFGTYSAGAIAAGFVAPQRGEAHNRPPGGVEEAAIVAALLAYLARERRAPTRRTWKAAGDSPSVDRIERVFGTWGHALHAAMIEPSRGSSPEIPDEDLLRIIRTDRARLGRWPTAEEWRAADDDRPSVNTVINRFGSWDQVKERARLYEPGTRDWGNGNLAPSSRVTAGT